MVNPRGASKVIRVIRDWLVRRECNEQFRYEGVNVAPRSQPLPKLPGGVATKMSANDYYTRDGRHESEPPQVVFKLQRAMITSGGPGQAVHLDEASRKESTSASPLGNGYNYGKWIEYDRNTCFSNPNEWSTK